MTSMRILLCFFALLLTAKPAFADDLDRNAKIAFLGVVFIDTSTEGAINGVRTDETARLKLVENLIRERFSDEGFAILDNGPIDSELENTANPANCYGCEVRMAQKLNADYVLVGVVQKVSNLIISMNLVLRDVTTSKVLRARSVDVRSNTDASWLRGMGYILKTAFFKQRG